MRRFNVSEWALANRALVLYANKAKPEGPGGER